MFKRILFLTVVGVCLSVASAANTTASTAKPANTTTIKPANTTTIKPASTSAFVSTSRPANTTTQHPSSFSIVQNSTASPRYNDSTGLDQNVEREVVKVLKLFEKILIKQSKRHSSEESSEESSSEESMEHGGSHHGPQGPECNNTYCSFGLILYTEFRKAIDSQNISQVAQKLQLNVTNSTQLQKSGFAGLIELFSRKYPELNPFYEQCPRQVNKVLANWVGAKTNNTGLNFTDVDSFPCFARMGNRSITYNWDNSTRSLRWTYSAVNNTNGTSTSSTGSLSLQFIFDGIDAAYNKVNSDPVITNFATKYWAPLCPNWYNDLVEIIGSSLVQEHPQKNNRVRRQAETTDDEIDTEVESESESDSDSLSDEETSSSEETQTRRGYGRRGYGRRGYGRRGYGN